MRPTHFDVHNPAFFNGYEHAQPPATGSATIVAVHWRRSLGYKKPALAVLAVLACAPPAPSAASESWWDARLDLPIEYTGGGVARHAKSATIAVFESNDRALRFYAPPDPSFSEWRPTPADGEGGTTPKINGSFSYMTSSGSLWVQLRTFLGGGQAFDAYKLITRNGSALTGAVRACGTAFISEAMTVDVHDRLWINCRDRVVVLAADGTTSTFACVPCREDRFPTPSSMGGVWAVVDRPPRPWVLSLIGSDGSTVASRSFSGPGPSEFREANSYLVWLRRADAPRPIGVFTSIVERVSLPDWTRSPIIRFTRGLSEQVATTTRRPALDGLAPLTDGSTWYGAPGFDRIGRLDRPGRVAEFRLPSGLALNGNGTGVQAGAALIEIGGRLWVRASGDLVRVRDPGSLIPSLPVLTQEPRVRVATRGRPIALLSSMRTASPNAIPGTRVTLRCITRCRGRLATGTMPGTSLLLRSSITLFSRAIVESKSTRAGYRSTTIRYRFTRRANGTVKAKIIKIDGANYDP